MEEVSRGRRLGSWQPVVELVGPRGHDLVRERDARRKSTRVIYDDEQRSYRAKSCPPKGLRRRPAPALSQLLSNVPHCLRRCFALATGRRSQRGPREFHHGLPGPVLLAINEDFVSVPGLLRRQERLPLMFSRCASLAPSVMPPATGTSRGSSPFVRTLCSNLILSPLPEGVCSTIPSNPVVRTSPRLPGVHFAACTWWINPI
jgi:hypothetical protein